MKLSTSCGSTPKDRQIRLMAVRFNPVAAEVERVDQSVAPVGVSSKAVRIARRHRQASARQAV